MTVPGDDWLKARKNGLIVSGGSGTDQPIVVATVCSKGRPSSQRHHRAYVPRSASWVLPSQSENHRPSEQPSKATPSVTTNAPQTASGATPPKSMRSSIIGRVQATSPTTGTSRAASLPSTISKSARSVMSMCVSVPRALSRQIAPAVAAGAARSTSVNCVPITAWKNHSPSSAIRRMLLLAG